MTTTKDERVTDDLLLRTCEQLVKELERVRAELHSIAEIVEPHYRGAGLDAKADWIIKKWLHRTSESESEIVTLTSQLEAKRAECEKVRNALKAAASVIEVARCDRHHSDEELYMAYDKAAAALGGTDGN